MNTPRNRFVVLVGLTLVLLISACVQPTPIEPTRPVVVAPTLEPVIETSTPTEVVANKVILLAPAGTDPSVLEELQAALLPLVEESGLQLHNLESVTPDGLDASVKIVIALAGTPNLMELVNGRPVIQFLSLNVPDAVAAVPNLSTMTISELDLQRQAFLAGYLAALITADYRVGVLASANDRSGEIASESFFVGAQYFCGLCNSRFGPIQYYPKVAYIADPTSPNSWQTAVDLLTARAVMTVFVQEQLISADLMDYLLENGMRVISPLANEGSGWQVSLAFDPVPGVTALWSDLVAGQGGLSAEYQLDVVSHGLAEISEGRMHLFRMTMNELMSGYILPAVVQ